MFGEWSMMWDSQHFDLGECVYRKDTSAFALREDVSVSKCNQVVEQLVRELKGYWGVSARIEWEWIDEQSGKSHLRHGASLFG